MFGIIYNTSAGMVPLVYLIGLVAMLFTALSYMAMARAFPVAGSVYAYASGTMGETAGFVAGWAMLLDYLLIPSLVYIGCAVALQTFLPDAPRALLAIGLLALNTLINIFGVETTAKANRTLLCPQLAVLAVFLVAAAIALAHGVAGAHLALTLLFDAAHAPPSVLFGELSLAVLNFLGFDAISTLSEEARDGARAIGTATTLSLIITALLFIAQTYMASLFVLGRTQFPPGTPCYAAFYDIAGTIGGPWLRSLTSIGGVLLAGIAGALTAQASTARLLYSMARDDQLPSVLAYIHPRYSVPTNAILLVAAITAGLILFFAHRFVLLSTVVSFGALVGFQFLHPAVVIHHWKRPRGWFRYRVSPAAGFIIIAYVLVHMETVAKLGGLAWLALGVGPALLRRIHARGRVARGAL